MKKNILTILIAVICGCLLFFGCNGTNGDGDTEKTYVTITFRQTGEEDIVKSVAKGESLTDVPTPKGIEGYTVAWDVTEFENIRENIIVKAVAVANTYKIYLDYGGVSCDLENVNEIEVKYGEEFSLPKPVNKKGLKIFIRWTDAETGEEVKGGVYKIPENLSLKAEWDDLYISE